eukprot:Skav208750  [mRNA]  locus=scaffold1871:56614:59564:+ [translate_table: standard]
MHLHASSRLYSLEISTSFLALAAQTVSIDTRYHKVVAWIASLKVMQLLATAIVVAAAAMQCFDDAVPLSERKNLTNSEGESYELGMWVSNWASSRLVSAIVQILIQELLGIHVRTAEDSVTLSQMYAIAGCATPTSQNDRGCGPDGPNKTYWHVGLEGWTPNNMRTWAHMQRYFSTAPLNLGSMGYSGLSGQYVLRDVIASAWEAEGLPLDFYRGYNASWHNPSIYFDRITAVNTSDLSPCAETLFFDSTKMQGYLNVTGDLEGVETVNGTLVAKCFAGHFWLPPACRENTSRCFLYLTSWSYELEVMMQRATIFDMPVVPADVRDWATFALLPAKLSSMFYWWQPDPTFLDLHAQRIAYPEYDPVSFSQGIYASGAKDVVLDA